MKRNYEFDTDPQYMKLVYLRHDLNKFRLRGDIAYILTRNGHEMSSYMRRSRMVSRLRRP